MTYLESNNSAPDIGRFLAIVWTEKITFFVSFGVLFVLSAVFAFSSPDRYTAEALLEPAGNSSLANDLGLMSQYSNFLGLLGSSALDGQGNKTALGIEILTSRKFVREFVDRHGLEVPLIAAKKWDENSGDLIVDQSLYDQKQGVWTGKYISTDSGQPSDDEIVEAFRDLVEVTENRETGFVTINVTHLSPFVAKEWVDLLVEDLNEDVRLRDIQQATSAINYLKDQMDSVVLATMQEVLSRLIEEQTKIVMLADISDEYLWRTIDPAVVLSEPSTPNRPIILALGILIGACFGIVAAILRAALRQRARK